MKGLTEKQARIVALADEGLTPKQIGQQLGLTETSIKEQLGRVQRKVKKGTVIPAPLPIEQAAMQGEQP